jgi:hypothetical protein
MPSIAGRQRTKRRTRASGFGAHCDHAGKFLALRIQPEEAARVVLILGDSFVPSRKIEAFRRNIMRVMAADGDGIGRQDRTSDLQLLVHLAPTIIQTATPDDSLDFFNQTWLTYVGCRWRICRAGVDRFHPSRGCRRDCGRVARVPRQRGTCPARSSRPARRRQVSLNTAPRSSHRHEDRQIVESYGWIIDIVDRKRPKEQLPRSTRELRSLPPAGTCGTPVRQMRKNILPHTRKRQLRALRVRI